MWKNSSVSEIRTKTARKMAYINPIDPVYISYSRKNNDNPDIEKPVEDLINQLKAKNIFLRIDTMAIKPEDSISAFEKEIGRGRVVVIFLTEKYLTSEHCMFEWTEIHRNQASKLILYVRVGEWKEEVLKEYWLKKLEDYKNDCVTGDKNPNTITKSTFKNNFYYKTVQNIYQNRDICDRWYSDDNINKIADRIKEYITDSHFDKKVELNSLIAENNILLVGDSILDYKGIDANKPLDKYIEEQLISQGCLGEYETLREWIRSGAPNLNQAKQEYVKILTRYENNIDTSRLKNLLEVKRWDIIFSFGYSHKIVETIQEYCEGEKMNFEEYYIDKSVDDKWSFYLASGKSDKKVEADKSDNDKKKKSITLYEFANPVVDGKTKNIKLTEEEIVIHLSGCIEAIFDRRSIFQNRSLLALGTVYPGWAIRLLWAAIQNFSASNSNANFVMSNKLVDNKSHRFIEKNSNCMIWNNESMCNLVDALHDLSKLGEFEEGKKNIYIFYLKDDYKLLLDNYDLFLKDIEKEYSVHFVWRKSLDDIEKIEKLICNCDGFILYRMRRNFTSSDKIKKNNSDQGQYTKELKKIYEHKENTLLTTVATEESINSFLKTTILGEEKKEPEKLFENCSEINTENIKEAITNFVKTTIKNQ